MAKKKQAKKPAKKKTKSSVAVAEKKLDAKQKLQREIAKRNKEFAQASAAEKRVLIAKDVIQQIKVGRFQAQLQAWVVPLHKNGEDLCFDWEDKIDFSSKPAPLSFENQSVCELFLDKKIDTCECCALGAMFMSCTLYSNKTSVRDFVQETTFNFEERIYTTDGFANGLSKFFSAAQLSLIEAAYEGGIGAFEVSRKQENAIAWIWELEDPKDRMLAIMRNIIENNGTFKP